MAPPLDTRQHGRHRPSERATPAPTGSAGTRSSLPRSWSPVPQWVRVRIAVGVVTAAVFGAALSASMSTPNPLDDPDLAMQRAGILDVVGPRSQAVAVQTAVPTRGRVAAVFFVRPAQTAPLLVALDGPAGQELRGLVDIGIVSSGTAGLLPNASPPTVVADSDGRLAAAYRMRRPRDGGPPVGYAVVDRDGTIRYRTLDPDVVEGLDEVLTVVGAVR